MYVKFEPGFEFGSYRKGNRSTNSATAMCYEMKSEGGTQEATKRKNSLCKESMLK
jgi:hypothetical protein